jgi:hypothetical protein
MTQSTESWAECSVQAYEHMHMPPDQLRKTSPAASVGSALEYYDQKARST